MQINLPIAICLFENAKKKAAVGQGPYRDIGVHQIRPDNPKSILQYSKGGSNKYCELVHHVVIFTPLSYAECQKAIRERIVLFSGADMIGKTKQIAGKRDKIVDAMNRISLDSSWLLKVQRNRLDANYPRHKGCDMDTEGSDDLDDFIDDDEDEDEDEDEDDDLDGFIVADDEADDEANDKGLQQLTRNVSKINKL